MPRLIARYSLHATRKSPSLRVVWWLTFDSILATSERCRNLFLQRAQEIQNRLLIARAQIEKILDYLVRLRGEAEQSRDNGAWLGANEKTSMVQDCLEQIAGPAIVQEEQSLAEAPQRRSAELIAPRATLRHIVSQADAHVVDFDV